MIGDLVSAVDDLREHVATYGWGGGVRQWGGKLYVRKTRSYPGRNVYDADWDVLVLLDACRVDLLTEVQDEYDFLGRIDTFDSLGSSTWEWMPRTFENVPESELERTAYVCANPFSGHFLEADDFAVLDEVWRYAWDKDLGTVPPRPVTDRAISVGRSEQPERLIVHYIQPHTPLIGSEASPRLNVENFGGPAERVVLDDWKLIHLGERALDGVWADYRDNLRLVLDDVTLLRKNIDAERFVVSSDHGNAAGEFGIYGHPANIPLPCLRAVPWVETTASDERTHAPAHYDRSGQGNIEERLSALGYFDDIANQ